MYKIKWGKEIGGIDLKIKKWYDRIYIIDNILTQEQRENLYKLISGDKSINIPSKEQLINEMEKVLKNNIK